MVQLPGGGEGTAGPTQADGNVSVTPLAGGAPLRLRAASLAPAPVRREQWARCLAGEWAGQVGKVVSVMDPDVVLKTLAGAGVTADLRMVARLADQAHWQAQADRGGGGG